MQSINHIERYIQYIWKITGLIFFSNFSENNIYQLKLFLILKIIQIHFVLLCVYCELLLLLYLQLDLFIISINYQS